jgi:hypothetical protein
VWLIGVARSARSVDGDLNVRPRERRPCIEKVLPPSVRDENDRMHAGNACALRRLRALCAFSLQTSSRCPRPFRPS